MSDPQTSDLRKIYLRSTRQKGPLPDPETLQAYYDLAPTSLDRLIDLIIEEERHRMTLEHKELDYQLKQKVLGLYLSAFITIVAFICSVYLALEGQGSFAGLFVGVTLVAIISQFIQTKPQLLTKKQDQKEEFNDSIE